MAKFKLGDVVILPSSPDIKMTVIENIDELHVRCAYINTVNGEFQSMELPADCLKIGKPTRMGLAGVH